MMNRSMVAGIVVGATIAVAGAVWAGYAMREESQEDALMQSAGTESETPPAPVAGSSEPVAASAPSETPPAPVAAAEQAPAEECWDEEVTHTKDPKDDKRIAGTAVGAVVGGVVGSQFGGGSGKKLATVAGAAGGAYAGRKAQEKYQENQTYTTTERRCRPVSQ